MLQAHPLIRRFSIFTLAIGLLLAPVAPVLAHHVHDVQRPTESTSTNWFGPYTNAEGVVDSAGLNAAVADYLRDRLPPARLNDAVRSYLTKEPLGSVDQHTVQVIDVIDGDTIDIRYDNGSTDTVRLVGVDTPEVPIANDPAEFEGIPDTEAGRSWLRRWGTNASLFTERIINGTSITLRYDAETERRGDYGRLLAYVRLNSSYSLNYDLVQKGYARVYESGFSNQTRYLAAEQDAQEADRGVWGFDAQSSTPTPTPTPEPSSDGELVVSEIHEDAVGNDHLNENDEYIVFKNDGEEPLDLGGWSVEDEADHTYIFPGEFILDAGDEVTLHTGVGKNTDTELYWGSDSAIWNNGGDTIFVFDESSEMVIERGYAGE